MNKKDENKWRKRCRELYNREAKAKYSEWIDRANVLAAQNVLNIDKYWELKDEMFKNETDWERCFAPCGYWPNNMRKDGEKLRDILNIAWSKRQVNNN